MTFLRYQRVRYVGPRIGELQWGAEGSVSDANNDLSKLAPGWLYIEFPSLTPRRHECRAEWLESI